MFPDTLGSLTTVRSATGVKTYGAEYWPYGKIQTETDTDPNLFEQTATYQDHQSPSWSSLSGTFRANRKPGRQIMHT